MPGHDPQSLGIRQEADLAVTGYDERSESCPEQSTISKAFEESRFTKNTSDYRVICENVTTFVP